jgi:hypothetical protein
MNLFEYLESNKRIVLEKWYNSVIDTYPIDSSKLFLGIKDKFSNPVGHSFEKVLPEIYDNIMNSGKPAVIKESLEEIIKLRAVQNFSPGQAVGFLFLLKNTVREMIIKEEDLEVDLNDILTFESKIDIIVSYCFDIYMKMKEKLFEIKANETRATFGKMVDRLNRKYGGSDNINE